MYDKRFILKNEVLYIKGQNWEIYRSKMNGVWEKGKVLASHDLDDRRKGKQLLY